MEAFYELQLNFVTKKPARNYSRASNYLLGYVLNFLLATHKRLLRLRSSTRAQYQNEKNCHV